ncbi:Isocitrate dehydrogenase [NADP] [Quillaja saponaria]|uniref:Isocitrate dehydrogenase [NADP] n=1 Tax=Quillaja saponaria TaxID=32244 RepID=A0AAD7VGA5_QUISA|nr:Isocitrate dehydrogenase [NADP] [Quillaja saponaria]
MLRANLRSAMSGVTMLSYSSSSSLALKNPSLRFTSRPRLFNGVPFGNRVSFSANFNHVSLRCYAASSGSDRIRVQNPIVEMGR